MQNRFFRSLTTARDLSNKTVKAGLRKMSFAFFIASLISGCATYHPNPISPSGKAIAFEARNLDNPALKAFMETNLHQEIRPWPSEAWDFTLLSLAAMYYHPELQEARAGQRSAEAAVVTAGARPNPSFTFTPELSANPPAGISPWIVAAALNLPIETADKRGYRINRAKYLANAAALKVAATGWELRSKLRRALLALSAERRNSAVYERQALSTEDLVLLLRRRVAAGEASQNELNTAQILMVQTRLQLQGAQTRATEALLNLASSIGLGGHALQKVPISTEAVETVPSLTAFSLPDLRRTALLSRPDVLAALAEYDAAETSVRLEIARQYPDLNLDPGYQWDQGQNKWSFGFSLTVPVFNRNEGPIAEAEARRGEAEARLVDLQARLMAEIDTATAAFSAASVNLTVMNDLMSVQKKRLDSVIAMFYAGEVDRVALDNARLDYHSAELSRLSVLLEGQAALGRLEDALQYPLATGTPSFTVPRETETGGR